MSTGRGGNGVVTKDGRTDENEFEARTKCGRVGEETTERVMIQEGGIGTRREDLENDEEQPADQREQPRTPHILQSRSHPHRPALARPIPTARSPSCLGRLRSPRARSRRRLARRGRVRVREGRVRRRLEVQVARRPALALSDRLEGQLRRKRERGVERVPDGEVDGLRVEVVLEDDESIMFIR